MTAGWVQDGCSIDGSPQDFLQDSSHGSPCADPVIDLLNCDGPLSMSLNNSNFNSCVVCMAEHIALLHLVIGLFLIYFCLLGGWGWGWGVNREDELDFSVFFYISVNPFVRDSCHSLSRHPWYSNVMNGHLWNCCDSSYPLVTYTCCITILVPHSVNITSITVYQHSNTQISLPTV